MTHGRIGKGSLTAAHGPSRHAEVGSVGKRTLVEQLQVQQRVALGATVPTTDDVQAAAARGTSGAGGTLPHLGIIQALFGHHDVSHVKAHTDDAAREGTAAMGAQAFASGDRIAFAGAPDLHTTAHEAAHVVQQRGGVQLKGGVGEAGDAYERQADAIADRVVQGKSVEAQLDAIAPSGSSATRGVQRIVTIGAKNYAPEDVDALWAQVQERFPALVRHVSDPFVVLKAMIADPTRTWPDLRSIAETLLAREPALQHRALQPAPWRQWSDSNGAATPMTSVPPSTKKIPTPLYHMTHYTALPSIRTTGLDPAFANSGTGLNKQAMQSGTTKYAQRDAALSAVYLAVTEGVAETMDNQSAGKLQMQVRVPEAFRDAYLRSSRAAGAASEIDLEEVGTTVLSFGRIPPGCLFVTDPGGSQKPLTAFPANYDWRLLLGKGGAALASIEQLRLDQERRTQRANDMLNQQAPSAPGADEKAKKPEATAAPSLKINANLLAAVKAKEDAADDDDDNGEWD